MKRIKLAVAAVLLAGCASAGTGEETTVTNPLDRTMKGPDHPFAIEPEQSAE